MDVGTVTIIAILVVVLLAAILLRAVAVVPQRKVGLVERLGNYRRTLPEGLSLIVPFVDKVRVVGTGERVVSPGPHNVVTRDNRTVAIATDLHVEVVDPVLATYEVADYVRELGSLRALRTAAGQMDLAETLGSRAELERVLNRTYHARTGQWGIKINQVVLNEIRPLP